MRVLITGASGLIGRRLTARLLQQGVSVTAFVRAPGVLAALAGGGVALARGDVEDAAAVARAAAGCGAVVHLANATGEVDEARVDAVNVGGTENVLAAARAAGVTRVIFASTISAQRERVGPYGRSKRAAEARVRAGGVPFVILRPSLVYGGGDTGLVATLTRLLRALPVMPVIGDGRIELDPVHLDDVCAVVEACLVRDDVLGRAYDVLGPDRVTLDEFLRRLGDTLGVRRPLLHLPGPLALLLARALGRVMARPPLTVDNVLGLISPARLDREAVRRDFSIAWTPLDVGLRALAAGPDGGAAAAA
jgi:nucleoside-diphosphate-sugar epimerase